MSAHSRLLDQLGCAFDASLDPVVVVDGAGARALYVNPAGATRFRTGEAIDPNAPFARQLASVIGSGEAGRLEWGEHGPSGVRSWFACTVTPLREAGVVGAWLCVLVDVTELKRNEERLRRSEQLMVDTQGVAHLGTWEWDVSEPHAYWSAELYRIYGLSPDTYTPSYEAYLRMVHPEDRQRVIEATNRVFHEHVPYSHDERIFRADGSLRYLHTWAYPILDDEGRLRKLVGVCQDITERKHAEEQVRELNVALEQRVAERTRLLEESMRDLEAFNGMVSHDLRGPLGTIKLACALLTNAGSLPANAERSVLRIDRAVTQMAALIDDLLAFARIGETPLDCAPLDVSALAQEIVADLRHTAPERVVDVSIEPGISCHADRGLFRIALANLIGNAWKYTSRTERPRIAVFTTDEDGSRVLVVRDNGAGFDMKDAHRLFAPFQRLHCDREFSGTGVGLASVRRVLARHGARVWAEGKLGQGATFYLTLPGTTAHPHPGPSNHAPWPRHRGQHQRQRDREVDGQVPVFARRVRSPARAHVADVGEGDSRNHGRSVFNEPKSQVRIFDCESDIIHRQLNQGACAKVEQ